MSNQITLTALQDLPLVKSGDDLCSLITDGLTRLPLALCDGDIIVVAQKIISKAEGRTVNLNTVSPSARAMELAGETQKDARVVELILSESKSIVRKKGDYALAPADAHAHNECGGEDGGTVLLSMQARTDGVLFEYFDENMQNPWPLTIQQYVDAWERGATYGEKAVDQAAAAE